MMAKKITPSIPKKQYFCRDCVYLKANTDNLSIKDKKPIMGNCEYQRYTLLINYDYCDKLKIKPLNELQGR